MPPGAFPYSTLTAAGVYPAKFRQLAPEYPVTVGPEYGDGGRDTASRGTTPTRRWEIVYRALTTAEAATLDTHYDSALGIHFGFNFTDPRTSTLWSNTKYESYEQDHDDYYADTQVRRMVLVRRP